MFAELINEFSYRIFGHLYESQNFSGNMAFNGIGLYFLMTSINFGLRGRSRLSLSHVLNNSFGEILNESTWRYRGHSKNWCELTNLMFEISSLNSVLYHACHFEKEYQNLLSELSQFHFQHFNISNKDEVKEILDQLAPGTVDKKSKHLFRNDLYDEKMMIYINTIAIHKSWYMPFDIGRKPKPKMFFEKIANHLYVSTMAQESKYRVFDDTQNNILFIPTYPNRLFAVIVTPNAGYNIKDTIKNFRWQNLQNYYQNSTMRTMNLTLPRFTIISKLNLVNTLKHFNITHLFLPHEADISDASNQSGHVKNLAQATVLDVNQSGFKVGVVTEADIVSDECNTDQNPDNTSSESTQFYVKKPFLLLVYSPHLQMILYTAAITDPSPSN
ncbi:Plasminogen activator inhibitor 1 [Thelohanellus kitauei]|uniref:Plasminogen activator inhibitor 1 n=1 Tax=Thelohanellus kitauei TaxID=669202 RepID=A0A0C2NKZ6_THEKT|nr:Plasminogen activator inhibitor 1 [Thelohanellus kitauei]